VPGTGATPWTRRRPRLASGRYRFDGPIVLDCGGAFGCTVRVIPRNDLLTSVAELGVVAVA
jgi:starch phosphorylase